MNPFSDSEPEIYIADIVLEFKYVFGKPSKYGVQHRKRTIVFEKHPVLLMNGKVYSKEAEDKLIVTLLKTIAEKPIEGTVRIAEINNKKFSSKIQWDFK